jgi:hypothetical protein
LSPAERIEPYDKRYAARGFDSGQPALDRWLIQYAGQNERRNTARTYLAVDDRPARPAICRDRQVVLAAVLARSGEIEIAQGTWIPRYD